MNTASKVGEIFAAAGAAFNRLGELTTQLHPNAYNSGAGKWSEEDIEMLHLALKNFAESLSAICERNKAKTVSQIKGTLRKKTFQEAGIAVKPATPPVHSPGSSPIMPMQTQQTHHHPALMLKNDELTLNMLNASESEVDLDDFTHNIKLEFGSDDDDVTP